MTTARPRRSPDGRQKALSYPPVSPCRPLADVLPLDYLTPDAEAWLRAPGPGCHSGADGRGWPGAQAWAPSTLLAATQHIQRGEEIMKRQVTGPLWAQGRRARCLRRLWYPERSRRWT